MKRKMRKKRWKMRMECRTRVSVRCLFLLPPRQARDRRSCGLSRPWRFGRWPSTTAAASFLSSWLHRPGRCSRRCGPTRSRWYRLCLWSISLEPALPQPPLDDCVFVSLHELLHAGSALTAVLDGLSSQHVRTRSAPCGCTIARWRNATCHHYCCWWCCCRRCRFFCCWLFALHVPGLASTRCCKSTVPLVLSTSLYPRASEHTFACQVQGGSCSLVMSHEDALQHPFCVACCSTLPSCSNWVDIHSLAEFHC